MATSSAHAQLAGQPGTVTLELESPKNWRLIRSPILLFESNWEDTAYLRSSGAKVEEAGPGLADRARRIDSALALKIDGERILRIFDLPDLVSETGALMHRFEAWLPESRHYVVSATCIHCRVTYLIDARDGRVTNIEVPPIVSPSGRLGLLWQANYMDGHWGPAFVDLLATPPTLTPIRIEPNCVGEQAFLLRPTARWLNNSRIEFTGDLPVPTPKGFAEKQFLRIVDGKPEWEC